MLSSHHVMHVPGFIPRKSQAHIGDPSIPLSDRDRARTGTATCQQEQNDGALRLSQSGPTFAVPGF
jgi:hypothetical protein